MKKILAIMLMVVMCITVLASCGGDNTSGSSDNGTNNQAAGTNDGNSNGANDNGDPNQGEVKGDTLVIDETTYDGYQYTVLVTGNISYKHGTQHYGNDFDYDENSHESLSDQKHRWIVMTQEKFDITIEVDDRLKFNNCNGSGNGFMELQKSYESGDINHDSCMIGTFDVCNAARNGYLADLKSIEYINLENSWWDQVANKDLCIQNKMYYTTGDISIVDNVFTHCIFFNKDMIKAYNLESPYTLVNNNQWTLDKMIELIREGSDTSGEGTSDSNVYGLLTWNDSMSQILASADERIATVDSNGELTFTMYNERTQTLYDKFTSIALNSAYSVNYQTISKQTDWDKTRAEIFDTDRALFYMNLLSTTSHHRDSETDFGIIPFPKLDSNQQNYGHLVSTFHTEFFCIPYFYNEDVSIGSITEFMAAKGQETTKVGYYDDTLIGKHIRDEESAAMLDIIFASRVFDVGSYYKISNIPSRLSGLYSSSTSSFSNIYNECSMSAQAFIDTINQQFMLHE